MLTVLIEYIDLYKIIFVEQGFEVRASDTYYLPIKVKNCGINIRELLNLSVEHNRQSF